ncbi:MAG TPA: hypothetical protein VL463_29050 [Kofleriaceae bacterium]|jgi:hypothetical protein|nr:hypothetical protein [Kofleriaceae bacterium]
MKPSSLVILAALGSTALASTAPHAKVHVLEGEYPSVEYLYAPWAEIRVAYPVIDGKIDRYVGTFEVALDDRLAAVARAADTLEGMARGHVRLERRDGEQRWHVASFTPDR